jgi:hypothetical protein
MITGGMKRKGMFGGGFGASMPQDMAVQEQAQMGVGGAQMGKKPGLGTRLLGAGWEDKAMALGGALMGNQFAIPQYLRQQGDIRQQAEQLAAAQRQQAMQMSAAQGMGLTPEQAALLGPEGLRQYTLGKLKGPEAPPPPRFEQDNAGNVWALDPMTGKPMGDAPTFVDPTERQIFQNGAMVTIPNPFAGRQAAPLRPVGKLTPIGPTIENTPAPQLNANGMPTSLSRAQYDAVVQRMGKADTEAWARRNNIRVTH